MAKAMIQVDESAAPTPEDMQAALTFDVKAFFPFAVHAFYQAVLDAVSRVYTQRYGLSVGQWRTLAILGLRGGLSASEIVEQSSMDKVTVSRATSSLKEIGLLKRDIDGEDRRRSVLRLSDEGVAIFCDLVPKVQAVEAALLAGFTEEEKQSLLNLMGRVASNARGIVQDELHGGKPE